MSAPASRAGVALATLLALAVGAGLWVLSAIFEDRLAIGALFPLARLVFVFVGLTLAERSFAFLQSRWFRSR